MGPRSCVSPGIILILAVLACTCVRGDADVEALVPYSSTRPSSCESSSGPGAPPAPEPNNFIDGVKFELFTRKNPEKPEFIDISDGSIRTSRHFRRRRETKIGVHGWLTDMVAMKDMIKAFLASEDVNFILVNWTAVDSGEYPTARGKVPRVAERLSSLLGALQGKGVDLRAVHVIGHSLGAHIAGLAGAMVRAKGRAEGRALGRITGLDPAGPLFAEAEPAQRLHASAAAFVDVIHTCGNILGYGEPLGHADFYPNAGKCSQPGCMMADLTTGSCSHDRAYAYFRESLQNASSFLARPCAGLGDGDEAHEALLQGRAAERPSHSQAIPMGAACPHRSRGRFCLRTRSSSPYGLGAAGLELEPLAGHEPEAPEAPEAPETARNVLRAAPAPQPWIRPRMAPHVAAAIRHRFLSRGQRDAGEDNC